jgi:hydroxymethylpyrimidine kinase/phosphomethylpyrimidine kinase
MRKVLLSVAGLDPSAGAGILLDLKVFARLGFHGTAVVTALTTQNTRSVKNVYVLPPSLVREQFRVLSADLAIAGIKIGMAGSRENLRAIGTILAAHKGIPKVVDPVVRSSSGARLLERAAVPDLLGKIRGRATVLTPNLDEAGLLAGMPVQDLSGMADAAKAIYDFCRVPCLIKGGHLEKKAVNLLYDGRRVYLYARPKIDMDVHGTGCFFSACLLGYLAQGRPLTRAGELATEFTYRAIRAAVRVGRGRCLIS